MKHITIKNSLLPAIVRILRDLNLDIKQSSSRRRFIRNLAPLIDDVENEQKELRFKYADKDANGEFIIIDNKYKFSKANKKVVDKMWNELADLDNVIDVTESNEGDILTIKEILKEEVNKLLPKNEVFNAEQFDQYSIFGEIIESLTIKD